MQHMLLAIVLLPLLGAIISGIFKDYIGRSGAHWAATVSVGASFVLALFAFVRFYQDPSLGFNENLFTWANVGGISFHVGFLYDSLTALMLLVVTFVSFMVHIYTIGYMHDDPGYQRFFSYIALFTFAMLMLVTANNFLQLFFGWEAVGLVSYLLIGFWFKKESAIAANMKAFLVNRVGDFGFILGIGAVLAYFGTLDYAEVFTQAADTGVQQALLADFGVGQLSVISAICILLFIGAMGKSAQVPLHVWLPDSMEGPTPISALIHAATMVTAGVFMVARMSPLFELSDTARSVVLVIGAITCLFMGLLGLVQRDIKRIVAYSTLSQLGYMVTALGASAYSVAIFHLCTHAFFKALLFLGAGSCIIAMHHEQDIFKMGNLKKYMPITYITMLMGTLAIIGFPGFAGFYSKDLIIEAVHEATIAGHNFAGFAVTFSVFITALYSFRLFFLVFHTKERMDVETRKHLDESPMVVWLPLVLLAVPSVIVGAMLLEPVLGDFFKDSITVFDANNSLREIGPHVLKMGWWQMAEHGFKTVPFMLAMAGVFTALVFYVLVPKLPQILRKAAYPLFILMDRKYYFDHFNKYIVANGTKAIGTVCSEAGDRFFIDGLLVNGTARSVGRAARVVRKLQSGYLYHYAFIMVLGLIGLFIWLTQL